jgi:hypothetical protein
MIGINGLLLVQVRSLQKLKSTPDHASLFQDADTRSSKRLVLELAPESNDIHEAE